MASRTGVPSMIAAAQRLCDLIFRFAPVIQRAYPGNAALQAALAAAMAACEALRFQLEEVRIYGD